MTNSNDIFQEYFDSRFNTPAILPVQVPHFLTWVHQSAQVEILEDGTESRYFHGQLPVAMAAMIRNEMRNHEDSIAISRGWRIPCKNGSISVRFGTKRATQSTITYSFDDWTVPLKRVGGE